METKHTPFSVVEHSWSDTGIYDASGNRVALLSIYEEATEENQDDLEKAQLEKANLIVRAVNSHDQLVSLLTRVRDQVKQSEYWWMDCPDRGGFDLEAIEAALAAAGEQS